MSTNLETEVTQLHAEICGGLADPNRILILYELSESPRNVTELSTNLKMPQPLVSRHLKILRERGMVIPNRKGNIIEYSLSDARLIQALDLLRAVMRDGLTRRAELVEALPKMFNSGFGLRTDGPVACGNRFWVQSSLHLYCIGDSAVKYGWNPASRPESVTRSLQP